jgi:hypothetical protein
MRNLNDVLRRADELLELGRKTRATGPTGGGACDHQTTFQLRASSLSFIDLVFGRDHPYFKDIDERARTYATFSVDVMNGVLAAARDQIASGWLTTLRGLVSAEVFSDFLEMAEHLLTEGYKESAAVMVGCVLEEHLRQLSGKHQVPVTETDRNGKTFPRRAAALNDDLKKANAYGPIDHKAVTQWLAVRNDAAHGATNAFTADQVRLMLDAVTNFLSRTPL